MCVKLIRLQAAFAALAMGLIAACSSGLPATEGSPATERPPATGGSDVSVRVIQYRSDEINRVVAVQVANLAEDPVTVESVEVVAPGFTGVGPVDFAATFPPGRSFDLRVPYGEPVCSEAVEEPVVVRLGIAGEEPVELRPTEGAELLRRIHDDTCSVSATLEALPLRWKKNGWRPDSSPEGAELLRRIHDDTCSVSATLEALPLRWKKNGWRPDSSPEGPVVVGTLLAGPVTGPETMRIVALEDTTLLTTSTRTVPLNLAPGRSASVNVVFTPQRCDAHAMADNKKGFEIGVRIARTTAADEDGVVVPVVPDVAAQDVLEEMVLERCGFADPSG